MNVKFKIMHSGTIMITIIMLIEPSPSQTKKTKYSLLTKKTSKSCGFLGVYLYLCKQIFRY